MQIILLQILYNICSKMNETPIQNTNFTIQFILDKIRSSFDSEGAHFELKPTEWLVANLLDSFDAIDITGGAAFMSTILKVTFHWKDPQKAFPFPNSIVMKVPGPKYAELFDHKQEIITKDEATQQIDDPLVGDTDVYLVEAHKNEISFYECFAPLDTTLRLPKFYFGSDYSPNHGNGLIIMEDLSTRAISLPTIPGFDEIHLLAIIDEISKIHSISWKHNEWKQLFPSKIRLQFLEGMRFKAEQLAQIEPKQIGPLIHKLMPMFTIENCAMSTYIGSKYGFPASIVHSDLWSPNILWEKKANGEATGDNLCAIIDWQTLHSGNPCTDLSRLLALHTPAQYRRQNTDRILKYYEQKVAIHMGGEAPFTMAQLRDAYKHSLPFSMMYLCFGVSCYYYMDSVVGQNANERTEKRKELLQRVQMFLEDTISEFGLDGHIYQ